MKRIIIIFNHFQIQDGVARSAIGIANALSLKDDVEVTLCPLFKYDKTLIRQLNSDVILKPVFKYYFRGMSRLVAKIPMKLLHKWLIGNRYDVEIGLCMSLPIKIVASYPNKEWLNHKGVINQTSSEHCNRVKRLAWMHGYDYGLTLRKEYERIGKVICVSQSNSNRLKEEAGNSFDVDYAYNLLDDEDIRKKGKEAIPIPRSDGVQFVTVGRISPEKGYLRLLEICKKLKKDQYNFNLWIIGDGPEKAALENKAEELQINDVVLFLGKQRNPHSYTSKSDVFICSSFSEGYSTACTEAIILGIPVITTDVSGGQEIIEEAKCGIIVPKDDDDTIYQSLKYVLQNKEIIKKWKRTLVDTRVNFSYQTRASKLYKLLELE